jgi:hypothetical protein
MRLRRVVLRSVLLAGLAAGLALAMRQRLVEIVAHRFEDAGVTMALVARELPSPSRDVPGGVDGVAEVEASTVLPAETITVPPLASTSAAPLRKPVLPAMAKQAKSAAPIAPLRVTRAEVDAAIASKAFGARTKLARDESGKPVGLALFGTGGLSRFGVQDGDVLVSANGYPLRTPEEAFAAVGALKDATRVTVVLRRGVGSYALTAEVAAEPQ